jgi:truncated hemoglobin YjbI
MADTLYDTIGGSRRINAAVELFYARVYADESLRTFFEGVDLKGLHARQSMFVSMLVGGQKVYTGKNLTLAHAGSRLKGLSDAHFDCMLDHFRAALTEIQVAPDRVAEIMTLLEGTRDAVLDRRR